MDFDGFCKTKKKRRAGRFAILLRLRQEISWFLLSTIPRYLKISHLMTPPWLDDFYVNDIRISHLLTFLSVFHSMPEKLIRHLWGAQTSSDSRSWATLNSPGMTPKIAQNQAFRLPIDAPFSWVSWSWLAANTVKRLQPLSFTSKSTNSNSVLTSTVGPWRPLDTLLMPPPKKENLFSQHDTHNCLVG